MSATDLLWTAGLDDSHFRRTMQHLDRTVTQSSRKWDRFVGAGLKLTMGGAGIGVVRRGIMGASVAMDEYIERWRFARKEMDAYVVASRNASNVMGREMLLLGGGDGGKAAGGLKVVLAEAWASIVHAALTPRTPALTADPTGYKGRQEIKKQEEAETARRQGFVAQVEGLRYREETLENRGMSSASRRVGAERRLLEERERLEEMRRQNLITEEQLTDLKVGADSVHRSELRRIRGETYQGFWGAVPPSLRGAVMGRIDAADAGPAAAATAGRRIVKPLGARPVDALARRPGESWSVYTRRLGQAGLPMSEFRDRLNREADKYSGRVVSGGGEARMLEKELKAAQQEEKKQTQTLQRIERNTRAGSTYQ